MFGKITRASFLALLLTGMVPATIGAQAAPKARGTGCCDTAGAACCVTKTRCCDTAVLCCDSDNAPCCLGKVNCCEQGAQSRAVRTVRGKKAANARAHGKQPTLACCTKEGKTSAKARR